MQNELLKFESILKMFNDVGESLENIRQETFNSFSQTEQEYVQGIFKKLNAQAFTALTIAREPDIELASGHSLTNCDLSTMFLIARSVLETYATLFNSVTNANLVWRELMQNHHQCSGYLERQKYNTFFDEQFDLQKTEKQKIINFEDRITEIEVILTRDHPESLRLANKLRDLQFGNSEVIEYTDSATKAYKKIRTQLAFSGLSRQSIQQEYGYFSQHVHNGYFSVNQIGLASLDTLRKGIKHALNSIQMVLCLTIREIGKRFDFTRSVIDENKNYTRDILIFCSLAINNTFLVCKGLFQATNESRFGVATWNKEAHPEKAPENFIHSKLFNSCIEAEAYFTSLRGIEGFFLSRFDGMPQVISWLD